MKENEKNVWLPVKVSVSLTGLTVMLGSSMTTKIMLALAWLAAIMQTNLQYEHKESNKEDNIDEDDDDAEDEDDQGCSQTMFWKLYSKRVLILSNRRKKRTKKKKRKTNTKMFVFRWRATIPQTFPLNRFGQGAAAPWTHVSFLFSY